VPDSKRQAPVDPPDGGLNPPWRLEMRGIKKSFDGVKVLCGVNLAIRPGEVVALLGANGAGKSTLMKILTGFYRRDAGDILMDGYALGDVYPRQVAARGISFLPQEISVMPDMCVAENIAIGNLPLRRRFGVPLIDRRQARDLAGDILSELGFSNIHPAALLGDLSVAEQRIVEIARALAARASIFIMDEPTASLSEQESVMIFSIIRRLKASMRSIFYISHYLKEVFEIADRIEVLRDGRNAGAFHPAQSSTIEVVTAMLGSVDTALHVKKTKTRARIEGDAVCDRPVLTVKGLKTRSGLNDISFDLHRGEIFGVFGLVGSGVEHLGPALFGAQGKIAAGDIQFNGRAYTPQSPQGAKSIGMGFVAAERKQNGIMGNLTVRQNLVAPFQRRCGSGIFASKAKEVALTRHWIEHLRIKTNGPEQEIQTLSGGNQQKICVARWLDPTVKILILDEPTRGVDIGARAELYLEFYALARNGLAILVLSSDVEEIAGLSDRSMVIDRGGIVAHFDAVVEPGALMAATAPGAMPGSSTERFLSSDQDAGAYGDMP